MTYTTFDFSIDDHIAHIRFNRPAEFNTLVMAFWQEIVDVFAEIERRGDARVVVISSTGKHFTAGLDLKALNHNISDDLNIDRARFGERFRRTVQEMQESFTVIDRCRLPVLAAIQGGCIGGGVDMISACDIRYCTEDAFFCIQEINIGMTADVGTLQRLPHLMPAGAVRELAYTGRRMSAARAREVGLITETYANPTILIESVLATAREISTKSPIAIVGTKEMLNYTRDHSVADALNYMALWQTGMFIGDDLIEQLRANQEKRAPKFADLLPPTDYVRRR